MKDTSRKKQKLKELINSKCALKEIKREFKRNDLGSKEILEAVNRNRKGQIWANIKCIKQ